MSLSAALRQELTVRAKRYAEARSIAHAESYGEAAVVCFPPVGCAHGNFAAASYRAIQANREWKRRLVKVHTSARQWLPKRDEGRWRELDSCMSSDALLMNVFCYPRVLASADLRILLSVQTGVAPQFGYQARVPLKNGRCDRTEVDLRLGNLLLEAKLTESDFQNVAKARMGEYRDFEEVFDRRNLPQSSSRFESYQVLRNILAAYATGGSFSLLTDARRPDLIERFYSVLQCIRPMELRLACRVVTWQEMAEALPAKLNAFLAIKYGIVVPAADHRHAREAILMG